MESNPYQRTEYERGYRDGYRDGLNDLAKVQRWPKPPEKGPRCPKCGTDFTGFMGYVCSQSHCPMMPSVTSFTDPEWQKDHDRSKY